MTLTTLGAIGWALLGMVVIYMLMDILWAVRCYLKAWGRDRLDESERKHAEHVKFMHENRFRFKR